MTDKEMGNATRPRLCNFLLNPNSVIQKNARRMCFGKIQGMAKTSSQGEFPCRKHPIGSPKRRSTIKVNDLPMPSACTVTSSTTIRNTLAPGITSAWLRLAQSKLPDAGEAFCHTLELSPTNVDALTQFGIVLARQNRLPEAEVKFRKAIELQPQFAKAHNNLGVALSQMGRRDEGLACYREATILLPDYAEAHFNLAVALADRQQNADAIASYQRAIQVRPDYGDALFNLGMLLVNERRTEEAVVCLEQAVRFAPDNSEAHNNLSLALADAGRFEDAVASCDAALRLRPLDPKSHMNRGNVLASLGRTDAALACYEFALCLQPDYINARWNRSLSYLAQGDFERGWSEYEWRWKKPETKSRILPELRWDGSSLENKTILLWCEQGVGDTLQFIRYAGELKSAVRTCGLNARLPLRPCSAPARQSTAFFRKARRCLRVSTATRR